MGTLVNPHTPVLLSGAYQLARRASEIPDEKALSLESKVWIYGSIFFSASYLESWINELFEFERFLGFQIEERHGKAARERIRKARDEGITGRRARKVLDDFGASDVPATLGKFDAAYHLLTERRIDRGTPTWRDAERLLKVRHELVHPIPDAVGIAMVPEPAVKGPGRIAALLEGCVQPNPQHVDPRGHPSNAYYSAQTARWAVRAAYRFVQDFQNAVGPFGMPDDWDHIVDRDWILKSG